MMLNKMHGFTIITWYKKTIVIQMLTNKRNIHIALSSIDLKLASESQRFGVSATVLSWRSSYIIDRQ